MGNNSRLFLSGDTPIISKTASIACLALAIFSPLAYPFFNTFLTAIFAGAACVLGAVALLTGARASYRVAAFVGTVVGIVVLAGWLIVIGLATGAATGSPL